MLIIIIIFRFLDVSELPHPKSWKGSRSSSNKKTKTSTKCDVSPEGGRDCQASAAPSGFTRPKTSPLPETLKPWTVLVAREASSKLKGDSRESETSSRSDVVVAGGGRGHQVPPSDAATTPEPSASGRHHRSGPPPTLSKTM